MADDHRTANAQQRRTAIFAVIETLLEGGEGGAREPVAQPRLPAAGQQLAQQAAHGLDQSFADLERDVADEAVADDHVHRAVVEVAPLDVADEVDGQALEQNERFAREIVALDIFFADRKQSHARRALLLRPQDDAVIDLAHDGELLQVFRAAVHVGADVNQDGGAAARGGHDRGQGRALNPSKAAQHKFAGGHDRAGVAGADQAHRASRLHQSGADVDRGGALGAARTKRDSSVHVCARLVKSGRAVGLVSAGNTGAIMATSKLMLGSLAGVQRPALATVVPTAGGRAAILIDVGANVDCRPEHLEQFAIMGEIYYRVILGAQQEGAPRVGLLSIGEEDIKGNDLTREAFVLLKRLPINFIGNVEGRDLYNGTVDVIVCDGF